MTARRAYAPGVEGGFAPLDSGLLVPTSYLHVGAGATDVCAGDDSRLSDARTPTAHASTHVMGGSDAVRSPEWMPSDYGLLAWTQDPRTLTESSIAPTAAGTLQVMRLHLVKASLVSNILLYVRSPGSGYTSGQNKAALFDSAGALVATTVDQSTAWASYYTQTCALTAPVSCAAGSYFVGFWVNASSLPMFLRAPSAYGAGPGLGILSGLTSAFGATNNTGLTTTAPATLGTITQNTRTFWAALS